MTTLKFLLKLIIAASIIWLVWDKFDFQQLRFVLVNPILFSIIPICWIFNQLLTTLRLHAMLRALERPTQLGDVFRANMSSLFVGNLIPGVIGADVVKFFYMKKHDPSILNTQLALVLGLDRILGLISILFWCSFFGFFIHSHHVLVYMPIAILILTLLGFVMLDLLMTFFSKFKLPKIIHHLIGTCKYLKHSRHKKLLMLIMVYNLLAVFVLLGGLVIIGAQLQLQQGSEAMFMLQFFLIPLVLIASMLPITPMGIGIAQITMAGAYELFGLDPSVGVSVSTLSQLGLLMVSVFIGGVVFMQNKSSISRFR